MGQKPPSASATTTPTGTTTGQVETELRSFLGRGYDNLVQKGKLEITQEQGDLQGTLLRTQSGTVAGVYDPKTGKVHLVADNIIADDARYVMLHEGGHALLREDKSFMAQAGEDPHLFRAVGSRPTSPCRQRWRRCRPIPRLSFAAKKA